MDATKRAKKREEIVKQILKEIFHDHADGIAHVLAHDKQTTLKKERYLISEAIREIVDDWVTDAAYEVWPEQPGEAEEDESWM